MSNSSYTRWPPLYGVTIIDEFSTDNLYTIPRSQTVVFPFALRGYGAVQVDGGHSSFYDNQAGTIQGWASDAVMGRSLTISPQPNLARISLPAEGFHWQFRDINVDNKALIRPADLAAADLDQWIYQDRTYYMCFTNLENKDNGLYVRFTYMLS